MIMRIVNTSALTCLRTLCCMAAYPVTKYGKNTQNVTLCFDLKYSLARLMKIRGGGQDMNYPGIWLS